MQITPPESESEASQSDPLQSDVSQTAREPMAHASVYSIDITGVKQQIQSMLTYRHRFRTQANASVDSKLGSYAHWRPERKTDRGVQIPRRLYLFRRMGFHPLLQYWTSPDTDHVWTSARYGSGGS